MKGAPALSGDRCESLLSAVAVGAAGWAPVARDELRDELVPLAVALQYGGCGSPRRIQPHPPAPSPLAERGCLSAEKAGVRSAAGTADASARTHGDDLGAPARAIGLLSELLRSPLRVVRLRALAALEHVVMGTGERGLTALASLDLDSDHHLRDHEPRIVGACLAGASGDSVASALGAALRHPSPARRKAALAGVGIALRASAWQPATDLIAGARRQGDDMTVFLGRLEALGSVLEGRAAGEALESLMRLRGAREWEPLVDAGYDAASPIARAAEPGPPLELVRRELIDPLLRCPGNSRRRGLRRLVGLRAHVTACRTSGALPLDPAWDLLADPMRKVRRAALWSLPDACEHAAVGESVRLSAELVRRCSTGTWQRACAALCAGVLEGPHGVARSAPQPSPPAPLPGERAARPRACRRGGRGEGGARAAALRSTHRAPALVAGAEILAACRLSAGSAGQELDGAAIPLLDLPETAGLAALGLGLLHRGTQNGEACEALLRWSARRKSARLRAAAAVAVGLVLRGADPDDALARLTPALVDKDPLVRRAAAVGLASAVFPQADVRGILESGCCGPLPLCGLSYIR